MKTELVETRGRQVRYQDAEEHDKGTADITPGGYEHPLSDHTNVHSTLLSYETIRTTCQDLGIESCNCCSLVGTVARNSKRNIKTRRIILCDAYVGPVGKCNSNGYGHSSIPRSANASKLVVLRQVFGYVMN